LDFLPKRRHPLREHDAAASQAGSKGVVERANAINGKRFSGHLRREA
jgi:hypothetical protein